LLSFISARVRRTGRRTIVITLCERQVGGLIEALLAALAISPSHDGQETQQPGYRDNGTQIIDVLGFT